MYLGYFFFTAIASYLGKRASEFYTVKHKRKEYSVRGKDDAVIDLAHNIKYIL